MSETTVPDLPAWATDEAASQIDVPDASKKANGWDSAERPPHGYMNWLQVQTYKVLVYLKARLLATAGLQADTELTITSGSVTPTQGNHTVDTEADAGTDDLANIVTTNLDDGRLLILRASNASRDVVIRHAQGGAGQVFTSDGQSITLDDAAKMVTFKRVGADWYEVCRSHQRNGKIITIYTATGSHTPSRSVVFCRLIGGGGGKRGLTAIHISVRRKWQSSHRQ